MLNILVVDDLRDFCENLKEILELEGNKVAVAHSGESAQEQIKKSHFDMVLLDVLMPGMDGIATLKKIREIDPHIPVIIMSVILEEGFDRKVIAAGANLFLKKPLNLDELISFVRNTNSCCH